MSEEIKSESKSHLEVAINDYAAKLDKLESAEGTVKETSVYEVLLARDGVENLLPKRFEASQTSLIELVELDRRLKAQNDLIGANPNLKNWREVLNPPETFWWWHCSVTPIVHTWDRLDWLWNTMTVACLGLVGSLMVNVTNAMSAGGAVQWPETFMTLMQGTGLALIAGGTLTSAGQAEVDRLLDKLNIPSQFRAEATLTMAVTLLLASIGSYNTLPKYLLYLGNRNYDEGRLQQALIKLTQANQIQPQNPKINIALGKVYESLNKKNQAMEEYLKVIHIGLPEAFNAAGRVQTPNNPEVAEALLLIGIQRAYIRRELNMMKDEQSLDLQYRFRTNLGWALLQQQRYDDAREELLNAINLHEQYPDRHLGNGMAKCFLIKANLALGDKTEAIQNWNDCRNEARPEFISEYQWLIDNGYYKLATCLDTGKIVVGLENVNVPELLKTLKACLQKPDFATETEPDSKPEGDINL